MNTFENSFERYELSNEPVKSSDSDCPNCWGYQQYEDKFRRLPDDLQVDVINHQLMYDFIQEFVVKQIDGVKLKGPINEND